MVLARKKMNTSECGISDCLYEGTYVHITPLQICECNRTKPFMNLSYLLASDVKRGQNLEAEANFWRLRPRPRPKIIMKKYQIMINNIRFKIIAGKIDKIPEFYTILPENARLHNKTRRSRPGRGQMFEAEAKA